MMKLGLREFFRKELKELFLEGYFSAEQFAEYNEQLNALSEEQLLDGCAKAMEDHEDEGEYGMGGDWWKNV